MRPHSRHMQNKEKLSQIGASMETSPTKPFAPLAEQTDICVHLRQMSSPRVQIMKQDQIL